MRGLGAAVRRNPYEIWNMGRWHASRLPGVFGNVLLAHDLHRNRRTRLGCNDAGGKGRGRSSLIGVKLQPGISHDMDDQKPSWTQWIDQFPGFPQLWPILHQVKCAKCPFFCEFPWCLSSTSRGVPVHLCHLRSGMPLRRTMGDPVWQLRLQGKKNTKQGRRMMEDDQQFSSVFKSTSWSRISRVYTYTYTHYFGTYHNQLWESSITNHYF